MTTPEQLMQFAIAKAREGMARGQSPFGCAVLRGEEILAVSHNTVVATVDITAHAEINALREACRQTNDILLEGAIVATTCEPCPMCMAALHWARVETVYYGATIADATAAGFNELAIPAQEIVARGKSQVKLIDRVAARECKQLFLDWVRMEQRTLY